MDLDTGNANAFSNIRYTAVESSDSDIDSDSDPSIDDDEEGTSSPKSAIHSLLGKMSTHPVVPSTVSNSAESSTSQAKKTTRRSGPNLTDQQVDQILDLVVKQGKSRRDVGAMFNKSASTIGRVVKKYRESGTAVVSQKGRTAPTKIDEEGNSFLRHFLSTNNTATLDQISHAYEQKFGIKIASSTLHHHLCHSMRITLKRAGKYPERRTDDETKQLRAEFVRTHIESGVVDYKRNCVFIDEASFNASMRRNYAWSNAGDPAHVHVPILRAPSTTLLAAVSNVGLIEVAMKVCPKNDGEKGTKKPVKKGTTR